MERRLVAWLPKELRQCEVKESLHLDEEKSLVSEEEFRKELEDMNLDKFVELTTSQPSPETKY